MKPGWASAMATAGLAAIMTAGFSGWSGSADTAADVLRARRIELVDQNGTVRARLNIEEGGEAVFRITGQAGDIRVKLGGSDDGAGLVLMDGKTEPAVHVLSRDASVKLRHDGREKILKP